MTRPKPPLVPPSLSKLSKARQRWLLALKWASFSQQECERWAERGEPMPPEVVERVCRPNPFGDLWPPPRRWQ